jgi:hypothetical protein
MEYRSLPRISNSDLSEFKNFIFGEVRENPVKAFAFGSALHELILEPHVIHDVPEGVDLSLVQMLARTARKDKFLAWALRFSKKETVQLWQDPATGLELKSKLDIVHKNKLVVDIKSTSCRDYASFLQTCEKYDYDRQAAFYLDSIGAEKFCFVAVQKVKPFNVWTVEHHTNGSFIASGRKKYRALLRAWKIRADNGKPFTPGSWQKEPLTDSTPC